MNIYNQIPILKDTAIALGCFDGIHLGHKAVIDKLNEPKADHLDKCVLSFSDDILFKNGAEHIASFEDKCDILSETGISELILPSFDLLKDYSPEDFFTKILMEKLDAKMVVCGQNYRFGKNAAGDSHLLCVLCKRQGIECIVIPSVLYEGDIISSSRIRAALKTGDIPLASAMLGRQFSYCFEVVHGRMLGRQLGTPTINQYFPDGFLIPAYGVYASLTEIGGTLFPSVTNIGEKPTVGSDKPLSETWIIGYDGDLYGRCVRVTLISYIRGECKFSSIDQLKKAIHDDSEMSVRLTEKYIRRK